MARPRDPDLDAAILAATRELLAEVGFAGLTIGGVAERAGASRPAVYRRWPNKAALALAAAADLAAIGRGAPPGDRAVAPDTGTLRGDLLALADRLVRGFAQMERLGVMGGLVAALATDPDFAGRLRRELLDPDQRTLAAIFDRARARGEVGSVDGPAVLEMLAGVVFYRQVVLHRPCPPQWRRSVVDLFVSGLARGGEPPLGGGR